jgi:S1-C subfamily serine protease
MNSIHPRTALITTLAAVLSLVSSAIGAEPAAALRPRSPTAISTSLGFAGQWIPGYGELVTEVASGSQAQRLGLERDDVILAVNGQRLTHRGAWSEALAKAQHGDGRIALKYRDCRTGAVSERQTTIPTLPSIQVDLAGVP